MIIHNHWDPSLGYHWSWFYITITVIVASRDVGSQEAASDAVQSGLPLADVCSAFELAAKRGHVEIQVWQPADLEQWTWYFLTFFVLFFQTGRDWSWKKYVRNMADISGAVSVSDFGRTCMMCCCQPWGALFVKICQVGWSVLNGKMGDLGLRWSGTWDGRWFWSTQGNRTGLWSRESSLMFERSLDSPGWFFA